MRAEELVEAAVEAAGCADIGDDWFLGPLGAWADDLEQDNLTEFGRRFARSLAVRDVTRRLRVLDTLDRHPEIAEVTIPPIVYVTGLERSGTTLLHNLLALHPQGRAVLRWELMEPTPPPMTATYQTDPRIAAVQESADRLRGSLLEQMHWVDADDPEECVWGFIDAVSMLGQAASLFMPAWSKSLETDQTRAYENYRRVLQLLLWKHPVASGGFLVLKAPQISRHIAAFAEVFPEAHFVITDRDPYRCITSLVTMGESIVEPFCVDNPVSDDGHREQNVAHQMSSKLAAVSAFSACAPERVTHVSYPALITDPAGTVGQLFDELQRPGGDELAVAVEQFIVRQRSGKRAAPPAALPSHGYVHDDVLRMPEIADYCTRYDVVPERTRLAG